MINSINLLFLGDIMPGGIMSGCDDFVSSEILLSLSKADIVIGTLESAIGTNYQFDDEKMNREDWRNIIYSPDYDISKLKKLGVNVVSLANNHIFDLGKEGLLHTIQILDDNGIAHFGAGKNAKHAAEPALIEIKGKRICILGYMPYWWEAPHPPLDNYPGINLFDIDKVENDIKKYKQQCDFVVVMPHWGLEYTFFPTERERIFVKRIIAAGADAIIGSHTHQIQPAFKQNKVPVCYSLGNFFFPDFYIQPTRPIWYPEQDVNLSELQVVYDYPDFTDVPVKRIWKKLSRIGLMVNLELGNKTKMYKEYCILSDDNIIEPYKPGFVMKMKLSFISLFLRTNLYKYIYFFTRYEFFKKIF